MPVFVGVADGFFHSTDTTAAGSDLSSIRQEVWQDEQVFLISKQRAESELDEMERTEDDLTKKQACLLRL